MMKKRPTDWNRFSARETVDMNYRIVYEDFGTDGVHGFITETRPDNYLIMINTRQSEADQRKSLEHELFHLKNDHFKDHGQSVDQIERSTHETSDQSVAHLLPKVRTGQQKTQNTEKSGSPKT